RAPLTPKGDRARCQIALPAGTRLRSRPEDGWRVIQRTPEPARTVAITDPELNGSIVLADTGARAMEVVDAGSGLATRCSVEDSEQSFSHWIIWNASP